MCNNNTTLSSGISCPATNCLSHPFGAPVPPAPYLRPSLPTAPTPSPALFHYSQRRLAAAHKLAAPAGRQLPAPPAWRSRGPPPPACPGAPAAARCCQGAACKSGGPVRTGGLKKMTNVNGSGAFNSLPHPSHRACFLPANTHAPWHGLRIPPHVERRPGRPIRRPPPLQLPPRHAAGRRHLVGARGRGRRVGPAALLCCAKQQPRKPQGVLLQRHRVAQPGVLPLSNYVLPGLLLVVVIIRRGPAPAPAPQLHCLRRQPVLAQLQQVGGGRCGFRGGCREMLQFAQGVQGVQAAAGAQAAARSELTASSRASSGDRSRCPCPPLLKAVCFSARP